MLILLVRALIHDELVDPWVSVPFEFRKLVTRLALFLEQHLLVVCIVWVARDDVPPLHTTFSDLRIHGPYLACLLFHLEVIDLFVLKVLNQLGHRDYVLVKEVVEELTAGATGA